MARQKLLPEEVADKMLEIYNSMPKSMGRTEKIMKQMGITSLHPKQVMDLLRKHRKRKERAALAPQEQKELVIVKKKEKQVKQPLQRPPAIYSNKGHWYYQNYL